MHFAENNAERVDQVSRLVARGRRRLGEAGDADEATELAAEAIALATSMEPSLFTSLDVQSMVSYLEMLNTDDAIISLVADSLELQADAADGSGWLIEGNARRQQARAVRDLLGPLHGN